MLKIFAIAFMSVCFCAADAVAGCSGKGCSVRLGPSSGISVQVNRSYQGISRSRQNGGRRSFVHVRRGLRIFR